MVVTQLAKERKRQLKDLNTQILKTMSGFNSVQREISRLLNRKNSIPEAEDLARLLEKMKTADAAFDSATGVVESMAGSWQ